MNEDARITLLQEILAGLIEGGHLAPLPEDAGDGAPLRLTVLAGASPAAASPAVAGPRARTGQPPE